MSRTPSAGYNWSRFDGCHDQHGTDSAPDGEAEDMSPMELMGLSFSSQHGVSVSAPPGPILVLAGPGARKTRCLTGRIAYLIQHFAAEPRKVCAVTFTNKAANEVAHRLRR